MEANPRIDNFMQDLLFTDRDKGEIVATFLVSFTSLAILWNLCPEKSYIY